MHRLLRTRSSIAKRDRTPLQDPTRRVCTGGGERAGPDEVPDEKTLDPMDGDDCVVGPNDPRVEPDEVQRDEIIFGDWCFSAAAVQVFKHLDKILKDSIKGKYSVCYSQLRGYPDLFSSMLTNFSVEKFQKGTVTRNEVDDMNLHSDALAQVMNKLAAERLSDRSFTTASQDLIDHHMRACDNFVNRLRLMLEGEYAPDRSSYELSFKCFEEGYSYFRRSVLKVSFGQFLKVFDSEEFRKAAAHFETSVQDTDFNDFKQSLEWMDSLLQTMRNRRVAISRSVMSDKVVTEIHVCQPC